MKKNYLRIITAAIDNAISNVSDYLLPRRQKIIYAMCSLVLLCTLSWVVSGYSETSPTTATSKKPSSGTTIVTGSSAVQEQTPSEDSLPTCTDVILAVRDKFKSWELIGQMIDGPVELLIFRIPDTGKGATYIRIILTPVEADVRFGLSQGWSLEKDATCQSNGLVRSLLHITLNRKEKV